MASRYSAAVPPSDDYDEVIVNEEDLREPVYETKQKDEDIIKCIGQLRVTYKYHQHSFQCTGLGTGTNIVLKPQYCTNIVLKPGQSALSDTNKFYIYLDIQEINRTKCMEWNLH
eukprot:280466_1